MEVFRFNPWIGRPPFKKEVMREMVKEIQLSQGKVALVDDEDYEWLNQWKWSAYKQNRFKSRTVFYAGRGNHGENKFKTIIMHRNIIEHILKEGGRIEELEEFINNPRKFPVDHVNGDCLDNRRCNLRVVTHRQNCQNLHVKSSSRYPGVHKRKNGWAAEIQINYKKTYLGLFRTELEAFEAYKKAVHELSGETLICEI